MSARDELAALIHRTSCEDNLEECRAEYGHCVMAATAIAEAGYSNTAASELADLRAIVEKHINMRSEYITALKNTVNCENGDYDRWQGGAEARRQLAQDLGWTVPYEPGDRTVPKEADDA